MIDRCRNPPNLCGISSFERFIMDVSLSKCSIDVLISTKLLKGRRSIRDYYYPVMVNINFQFDTTEKVQLIIKKEKKSLSRRLCRNFLEHLVAC